MLEEGERRGASKYEGLKLNISCITILLFVTLREMFMLICSAPSHIDSAQLGQRMAYFSADQTRRKD